MQTAGDEFRNGVEHIADHIRADKQRNDECGNGDAQRLNAQRRHVQQIDCSEARLFRGLIRRVLEHHGNGAGEHGEHLTCGSDRQRNRYSGSDALLAHDHQDGGDNAG